MAPYTTGAAKANNVTKLADYRQLKPAGFIDDNPIAYACGRRDDDRTFMAANPLRRFRADTALSAEISETGLAPLPRGYVALRLCALAPGQGAESPVLLLVEEEDIARVNEAAAGGDAVALRELTVTFYSVRSASWQERYRQQGARSLVTAKRCFAWNDSAWEAASLSLPTSHIYDRFDPHYLAPPTGGAHRLEDRIRPFSMAPEDIARLPRREWIADNMLGRGLLTQIVAPGSAGKSLFTIQLAVALARGDGGFTGVKVNEPARVLVVNLEDDLFEQHRRLAGVLLHFGIKGEELGDRLHLYDQSGDGSSLHLAKRDAKRQIVEGPMLDDLTDYVRQHRIDVVMFDPLVELHQANEFDNSEMATVMMAFKKLARVTGAAVMFVHHTRKPDKASSTGHAADVDTGRGASAIPNATRVTLTLFTMTAGEAKAFGVADLERGRFVRLDDAKTNYFLAAAKARWFKRTTVALPNGDDVGVLAPVSFSNDRAADCQLLTANLMVAALSAGRQLSPKLKANNSAVAYLIENQANADYSSQEFAKALETLRGFDFDIEVYRSGGKDAQRYVLTGQAGRIADASA